MHSENLVIRTIAEYEPQEPEFLWYPYLPRKSLISVVGNPGEGKSTMCLAIAAALTTGQPLPGQTEMAGPIDVLYQTAEDSYNSTVKPRLERLGADCNRVHVIDENDESLTLTDGRIEAAIERTGAKLMIFDTLTAYLGGANIGSASGTRPAFKHLARVAERTDCSFIFIGHLTKRTGSSVLYRGLGSIDIAASVRSILSVGRLNETERAFTHTKSNLTAQGVPQSFSLDEFGEFSWNGECVVTPEDLLRQQNAQGGKLESAVELLRRELSFGERAAVDMFVLADKEGISERTLKSAKALLGVRSERRGGVWFWSLPFEAQVIYDDGDVAVYDTVSKGANARLHPWLHG
ncbi:MAG: AAA family ATPase [Oscillospiraceae bacterium]|jgi:hypothetical protein|nr:AAA family ATPase [Oscillospiraceae bacterium]